MVLVSLKGVGILIRLLETWRHYVNLQKCKGFSLLLGFIMALPRELIKCDINQLQLQFNAYGPHVEDQIDQS